MAITTMDGALAGMQYPREFFKALTGTMVAGRPHSLAMMAGIPPAMPAPASGIGGEVLTSCGGQLPFTNPAGGSNTYLAKFLAQFGIAGTLLLVDRLWQNSGIDVTLNTEQTFTSSAQIPARDENGTNNGVGVYAGLEVITGLGAGTPTITLKYTNSAGAQNHTALNTIATAASSIVGSFYPIGLQAGDDGIQKAQSLTLSATMSAGTVSLVLYRVISRLELSIAQTPNAIDLFMSGFTRMYDNSVPFLIIIPQTTTSTNLTGEAIWTQG